MALQPIRSDRQLLLAARSGEEAAFATLYRRYGPKLRAYFLPRTAFSDPLTEDLRQQVFLRLLESPTYQSGRVKGESLHGLLFTIAANLLRTTYRDEHRRKQREADYGYLHRELHLSTDTAVDSAGLAEALVQLPDTQRVALDLRFRKNYSVAEIAEATDTAPGTVKSRLHYGLKKLATLLTPRTTDC